MFDHGRGVPPGSPNPYAVSDLFPKGKALGTKILTILFFRQKRSRHPPMFLSGACKQVTRIVGILGNYITIK